jgi:hypothetical protein
MSVLSHPFAKNTAKGWGTQVNILCSCPAGANSFQRTEARQPAMHLSQQSKNSWWLWFGCDSIDITHISFDIGYAIETQGNVSDTTLANAFTSHP